MAKQKISEWSQTAASNTDLNGISCAEGMAPSDVNNWMRELMSQVKDFQIGADGDPLTVAGTFVAQGRADIGGALNVTGLATFSGGVTGAFTTGMIMLWSGTIATIPSGWALCDGNNGTPNLTNVFVIGASADDSGLAKTNVTGSLTLNGGSKDAIVVSHTHTGTTSGNGAHSHNAGAGHRGYSGVSDYQFQYGSETGSITHQIGTSGSAGYNQYPITSAVSDHTHTFTTASSGSSGTNANLPPYYALAYIMKL